MILLPEKFMKLFLRTLGEGFAQKDWGYAEIPVQIVRKSIVIMIAQAVKFAVFQKKKQVCQRILLEMKSVMVRMCTMMSRGNWKMKEVLLEIILGNTGLRVMGLGLRVMMKE